MPESGAVQQPNASTKPNLVFFMVDQMSAKWLEAASAGICPTPNFDRLRARGVTFANAITSNALCQPARSTLATGLSTRGHGVLENGYQLDPALPTFMQILQKGGWRTGAFGKCHFTPHHAGAYPDYHPYGFDVTRLTSDHRQGDYLDWVRQTHPEHFDAVLSTAWTGIMPQRNEQETEELKKRLAEARKTLSLQGKPAYLQPFPEEVSQTAWITRQGIQFIREVDKSQPFLAFISYIQPHPPYCAPEEDFALVDPDKIPPPLPAEWVGDPLRPQCFTVRAREDVPKVFPQRRFYFAQVAHLDHNLGEVLDALEETGRRDNTYIIFLCDHGEMLMDHGMNGKAEFHYDACIRVPMAIAGPGLRAGLVRNEFVQLEDIFPTVLEMTGLPCYRPLASDAPGFKNIETVPGKSLLALCRGEAVSGWRQAAYSESYNDLQNTNTNRWARTIRTREYRYTMYPRHTGEQLFHISEDPNEQRNLAGDSAYARVRQELRDQLLDLIILQDYPHPTRELFRHGVH